MIYQLEQLTVTRFFAALLVVTFHFGPGVWPFDDPKFVSVLRAGPQAVTYFYVLSGFIMAAVHMDLCWRDAPEYWLARFARIYPVYFLGIISSLWLVSPASETDVLLNAGLLQAWFPGHALSVNGVGWSLSVEVFFYALFPLLIGLARRMSTPTLLVAVFVVWVLGQIWASWFYVNRYTGYPSLSHDFMFYFPILHLTSFLLGMAAGVFKIRGGMPNPGMSVILFSISLLLVIAGLRSASDITRWTGVHVFGETGLLSPIFALLVISLCSFRMPVLSGKIPVLLGEVSYSMYILQVPVFTCVQRWLLGLSKAGLFWPSTSALILVSCAVFITIETPCRRWIRAGGHAFHKVGILLVRLFRPATIPD